METLLLLLDMCGLFHVVLVAGGVGHVLRFVFKGKLMGVESLACCLP